ncbi:hypothetical protein BDN72DRAFT_906184 [Pluteus cervinus]|uniref:Uncharacterized protein n=1 Tax=Pluteus cervinus TaxID=181527 RepID=A0ACD2ZZP2_9AGAR|nr:hypothetical protein BDN72DRAFT_906184 [Pluteus cervinus]
MADTVPQEFSHLVPLFDAIPDGSHFDELKCIAVQKRYSLIEDFHKAYENSEPSWKILSKNLIVRGMAKTAAATARSFHPAEREAVWDVWMQESREYEYFYKEVLAQIEHEEHHDIDKDADYEIDNEAGDTEEDTPVIKKRRVGRQTTSQYNSDDEDEPSNKPRDTGTRSKSSKSTKARRKKYKPLNTVKLDEGQGKICFRVVINPRPTSPDFQGNDPIKDDQMNILYLRSLLSTARGPDAATTAIAEINPDKYLGWCAGCVDSTRDECGFIKWGQRCAGCARTNKTGCIYSLPSRERAFRRDTMHILGSTGPMNVKHIVQDITELQLQAHTTMALFKHTHMQIVNKQRELACLAREIYKEGPETVKEIFGSVDIHHLYLTLKESIQTNKVDLKENELEDLRKMLEAAAGGLEIKKEEEVKAEFQ